MGQWPSPVVITVADGELFSAASALWVNITSPAEGATVTNAAITVQWAYAPGTQQTARVRVYSDLALTDLLYDSGTLITTVKQHTIPEGSLDSGGTYYMRVDITTTDFQIGSSDVRTFSTSYAPANLLTGLRIVKVGDQREAHGPGALTLPGVRIYWTQASLVAAEQFLRYSVWRRVLDGSGSGWERIASVSALATTTYFDHTAPLFEMLEYDVTFSVHNTTTNSDLTSTRHAASAAMRTTIHNDFTYLHDVNDESNYVQYFHYNGDVDPVEESAAVLFWGSSKPVFYVNADTNYRRFNLPGLPDEKRGTIWDGIQTLRAQQREAGSVVCLRIGQHAVRAFCAITAARSRLYQGGYAPEIELIEVEHEEAVS